PNVLEMTRSTSANPAPAFVEFERYCHEYPKNQEKNPCYKNVLKSKAHSQSPVNAMAYASSFFRTISAEIRKILISQDSDFRKCETATADADSRTDDEALSARARKTGSEDEVHEDVHDTEAILTSG